MPSGWVVLMKGVSGVPGDLWQLWSGTGTANENIPQAQSLTNQYPGHYKPPIANEWSACKFERVRVGEKNQSVCFLTPSISPLMHVSHHYLCAYPYVSRQRFSDWSIQSDIFCLFYHGYRKKKSFITEKILRHLNVDAESLSSQEVFVLWAQVKVAVYSEGVEKGNIVFNVLNSGKNDWFRPENVISSTWNDLPSTATSFSMPG